MSLREPASIVSRSASEMGAITVSISWKPSGRRPEM